MITTLADPWLAQNAGRKYPLADDSETGIPDDAILDFRCSVRGIAAGSVPVARLYYIGGRNDPYLGLVKYADVEILDWLTGSRIGTVRFDVPRNISAGSTYTASAENGDVRGTLTVMHSFTDIPYGSFSAEFARTTVVCDSLGVDSLQGVPGVSYGEEDAHHIDDPGVVLTGDIALDAGANADPYLDGSRLKLEIAKGYGRGEWCQRQDAAQNCGNVLFTINGERPGSDGDIRLVGEGGVTVTPHPDRHAIEIGIDRPASELVNEECRTQC